MKINCDWFKDWRMAKRIVKLKRERHWHPCFMLYIKVGPKDCRLFEVVERRLVSKRESYADDWYFDGDEVVYQTFEYKYRARK